MRALNQEEDRHGLRIAPLIDIVFLLLIFFLVATTFYEEEKDITIRLAKASQGTERDRSPRILVVNVKKSGAIIVDQRVVTLDQLESNLTAIKKETSDLVVVVRCDRHAYHKDFVQILNLCERIGVQGVAVATLAAKDGLESP